MSQDLHTIQVTLKAQIKEFKDACEEVKKSAANAANSADKSLNGINDRKAASGVQKTLDKMKSLSRMMKEFGTSAKLNAGLIGPTQRAAELQTRFEEASNRAADLKAQLDELDQTQIGSEWHKELSDMFAAAQVDAYNLEAEIRRLGVSGSYGNLQPPSFIGDMKAYVGEARREITRFNEELRAGFRMSAPPGLLAFMQRINGLKVGIKDAGSSIKRFAVGVKNDMVTAGRHLGNFLSKLPLIGRARGHTNSASAGFRMLRRQILSTALAMVGAVLGFNAIKEGMSNLEQYSSSTRNDLNMLRSSLLTCKNALATAFAPILSVVAPLLSTLIDWITAAATALAHFISALTGKQMVVVARKAGTSVSDSMSGAADATNSANSAAQEYQRTLMGFDKINKLDAQPSSSGSGGSGSGGGVGGADVGSMFETVQVGDTFKDWAEKFKEAWKNADFYDIGQAIGTKLKEGLDNIPWDKIQEVGNKVAKSIATGLNGFLETPGLFTSVGTTLAQALNTAFGTVNTFAKEFHWTSLGKAVSDTINAFFKTFKFDQAAETISNLALGILDFFTSAVKGIDWSEVGASIVTFFKSIKWVDLFVKAAGLMASVAEGISALLQGAIEEAIDGVEEWIESGQIWKDLFKAGKATLKLYISLVGAEWTLIKTIAKGVVLVAKVTGKKALEGIKNAWAGIKGKTKTVTAKAKTKAYDNLKKFHDAWVGIKGKAKEVTAKAKSSGVKGLQSLKDAWASFKNGAKKKMTASIEKVNNLAGKYLEMKAKITGFWDAIKWKDKWISFRAKVTGVMSDAKGKIKEWLGIKNAEGGVYKNGSWHPVQTAATGGSFNGGQMFIAREAGPELVGTIGGHTAVMNNDQIVASVAAGVAEAVASVMGSQRGGKDFHIYLEGDAGKIFRIVRAEAQHYTNSTGQSAFPV